MNRVAKYSIPGIVFVCTIYDLEIMQFMNDLKRIWVELKNHSESGKMKFRYRKRGQI
jgi:hypothetical protein